MFTGAMVAIVTPFRGGHVDRDRLADLIEFQIAGGIDAIVPCGTTGESATLTPDEHRAVVEFTIGAVKGRVPVIAGTGSNATAEAIEYTRHAKEAGADAALLITPYYNRPTQEGLYQHYLAVAAAVAIPLIPYNVPGRTGVNMLPETVARLASVRNIVGIKEASGSIVQVSEIIHKCPETFAVLSGEDAANWPILAVGGKGMISVTANVAPGDVAAMWDAFSKGDYEEARRLHYKLMPLNSAMFFETNPIPVKTALGLMGKIDPELRLPLTPMAPANVEKLRAVLVNYRLV